MTVINPNQIANGGNIPNDINTLEKLLVWAGSKYNQIYGSSTYGELQPSPVDAGQRPISSADVAGTPAGARAIIRASIPMPEDWQTTSGAAYSKALEQSAAVLP